MNWSEPTRILATCGRGCAGALQKELRRLGYVAEAISDTVVGVEGDLRDAMRLNLWLRTANRILFEVAGFAVESPDELYAAVRDLPWEEWLRGDVPFHIHGVAEHSTIRDSRFALLRCKDAIADRFVAATGARPDSTARAEGAAGIALFWQEGAAHMYLDTSGVPLSHRGYRWRPWTAPLRETLAAAILLELNWPKEPAEALVHPMCGSGTLAIEAAWMAQNRAPGLSREAFAFEFLNDAPMSVWEALKEEARGQLVAAPRAWISAGDNAPAAVVCARENAERAGVAGLIRFHTCDFRAMPLPKPPALVVLNPGYGERVGLEENLGPLYENIGTWLKMNCQGMRGAVFTGSIPLGRQVGLRPSRRTTLWNGPIECRLLEYELYAGTRDSRLLRKHAGENPPQTPQ